MVPIPFPPGRPRSRGYNQAERITLALLPHLAGTVSYAPDVLRRQERKSQVEVKPHDRKKNIAGAFSVNNPAKVSGKEIILIDDVVESGATLSDARRALTDAGATEVIAIAIAH